ncbi:hypothetical protein QJS04_geneDACA012722 [Acorus gramineus]|uniref:Reverse transcriptase domain-containing protein n=1 Tax=Acorus gramineus TaxID=55184 RepID=A0AAV9A1L5_ACOGR|nr:hypothetical protein QJS04_geneDACA012722 [Acorus gramineus]
MTAQECITVVHKDKRQGLVIKLDFAKAYDNVRWDLLFHLLRCHGFEPNWMRMVEACVTTAKASVLLNGCPCGFFNMNRGLRQGDPISPLLFVIVANAFSRMMLSAEENRWVTGLLCSVGGSSISHMQDANDTVILCEASERSVRGVKFICRCFELVSGLKINFRKRSLVGINVQDGFLKNMAQILGCERQSFPMGHLGMPLCLGRVPKVEWMPLGSPNEMDMEMVRLPESCVGKGVGRASSIEELHGVQVVESRADRIVWKPTPSTGFSVKSSYSWVCRGRIGLPNLAQKHKEVWGCKVPLKVRAFMWTFYQGKVLTKSYLARWAPEVDRRCVLCGLDDETMEHLFLFCPMVREVWGRMLVVGGLGG